jgi:hypothetical protein
MEIAVVAAIVVVLVAVVAVSVWLSRHSPAALSQEGSSRTPASGGAGRPGGPGAEAMGVPDDPGSAEPGPLPPGGEPVDTGRPDDRST